jgi:hypothetical protein
MKYTENIIIIGSGTTTRANVEALLDDYVYANKNLSVSIHVSGTPSEGQIWAAQYAIDQEREVIVHHSSADKPGIFTSMEVEIVVTDDLIDDLTSDSGVEAFFLWNDDDPVCLNALSQLSAKHIPCKDLTNGLCDIKANDNIQEIEAPVIPIQEQISEEEESTAVEDLFSSHSFTDLDDDEEEYEDPLYEGIRVIADIFADAFIKRLKERD